MTTSLNSTTPARDAGYNLVQYLRRRISISSGGLVTTVAKSLALVIPANAAIIPGGGFWVTTNFDGTTNTIDIGYAADGLSTADPDAFATLLAVPVTTGGFVALDEIASTGGPARVRTVDTNLTATFTGTATTGAIDIIVPYVTLNNVQS